MRQLVGYLRFDSEAELVLLNEIWSRDALFTNYLLAQQKLLAKHREGATVTKRYDRAQTPHQRARAHEGVSDEARAALETTFATLHVAALYDQIQNLVAQLEHVALTKGLAPIRRVHTAFNHPLHPEVLDEAMNQSSRRI